MRKSLTLLLLSLFACALFAQSPIIINSSDMPATGDTFRYHTSPSILNIDLNQTGANQQWDFSNLISSSNYLDEYVSVQSTGLIYSFAFWQSDNALLLNLPDTMGQIPLQDVYNYLKINSGDYEISGFGATISGAQIPIKYNNPDVLYTFPLTYNTADSSDVDFAINIPSMGAYARVQKRINYTDGWGTLTTPEGTYDVLRVVSHLEMQDTLTSNSIKFGYASTRLEYKWISKDKGVPVVQVLAQEVLGQIIPYSLTYLNETNTIPSGINQHSKAENWQIYPNPVHNTMHLISPHGNGLNQEIALINTSGALVQSFPVQPTDENGQFTLSLDRCVIPSGLYCIRIISESNTAIIPIIVE